jgi:hypothetical protein
VEAYKHLTEKLSKHVVANEETLVYYPLLHTEKLQSMRAFSIIVFYHLCLISAAYKDEESSAIIFRLAMQVLEGLIDSKSRQKFQTMMQSQPKTRRARWKRTPSRVFVQMRPILLEDEMELILPVINQASFKQKSELLQILTPPTNEQNQQLYIFETNKGRDIDIKGNNC